MSSSALSPLQRPASEAPQAARCSARLVARAPAALRIERLRLEEAAHHRDAWVDLMGRALEPNLFLDPDFALPAARHLDAARRPFFVLVWAETQGDTRRLVAVCPLVGGRNPLRGLASLWYHDLSTLGFPLLDAHDAGAAIEALLDWAARALPCAHGLVVRAVPAVGPTAHLLREVTARTARPLAILDAWERALLRRGVGTAGLSSKGAKDLRRQRRRLAERGTLGYASAEGGEALVEAVERFLALEAAGWKGRAGTALLVRPAQTAFARTATRLLARRGLCRIDSLTLDGEPIAMGIVLTAGDTDHLWKIAFAEELARFSPGVQFVIALTAEQAARGRAAATDSCATANHPMIDRIWRGRLALADMAVATRPGGSLGFTVAVAVERRGRALRGLAKTTLAGWRRRRGSGVRS